MLALKAVVGNVVYFLALVFLTGVFLATFPAFFGDVAFLAGFLGDFLAAGFLAAGFFAAGF